MARELGLDPADPRLRHGARRSPRELLGFPRHLSQHVGGFVMTRGPLDELVPIENAAMDDRTVIEWDKDDLDALGMLKVDVLALGMLTCIRKALRPARARTTARHLDARHRSRPTTRPSTTCCAGPTSIGVFQVESRAQMSMLPRLKPADFYDLVIEVAIVRPGPIQGDMVHPYLRRRERRGAGRLSVERRCEEVLEQDARRAAVPGAGDADRHRRRRLHARRGRPAAPRHGDLQAQVGTIHTFREQAHRGHGRERLRPRDFAERCFSQIEGFGDYGFPESHAASFALLVYVSAWMKCHYPAVFACALLNSQPMGFYAPAQIVRDAREHGVEVRAGRRQPQRLGLHAGADGRRGAGAAPRLPAGQGLLRGRRKEARRPSRSRLRQPARSRPARRPGAGRDRLPRPRRCVPLHAPRPPRGAVGGARRPAEPLPPVRRRAATTPARRSRCCRR